MSEALTMLEDFLKWVGGESRARSGVASDLLLKRDFNDAFGIAYVGSEGAQEVTAATWSGAIVAGVLHFGDGGVRSNRVSRIQCSGLCSHRTLFISNWIRVRVRSHWMSRSSREENTRKREAKFQSLLSASVDRGIESNR